MVQKEVLESGTQLFYKSERLSSIEDKNIGCNIFPLYFISQLQAVVLYFTCIQKQNIYFSNILESWNQ